MSGANFGVGQVVHHRFFDYRGVIFDVDPKFEGTEEWYEKVAESEPPRDQPWYHVLVDGADHTTYVAERNLEVDPSDEEIDHPLVRQIFERRDDGSYVSRQHVH
jgi:heat shock protein HspQ